ncbi:hypothetical protein [Arenibacter amylolyticus]|nr:hypothetical protein [Arenibacter amylolyticus]
MKTIINLSAGKAGQSPTESRRFNFFYHLKSSKRIRCAAWRHYLP